MEEDDKIVKTVTNQNVDSGDAGMGSNESKNNKLISSIKGEGKKKGNESNKMNKDKLESDNNSSKMGSSQAFEEKEVIDVIRCNNLGICAVIESHVKVLNLKSVCAKTFGQWDWISNNNSCEAGTRIIVGWNPRLFDVILLSQSKQVIFNVAIKPSEYSESCSRTPKGVEDFVDCLSFIEVEDLKSYGFQFTWNKTPMGNMGLLKKLDRVMVNQKFISNHPLAHAVFKPYRNSDHCPAILNFPVEDSQETLQGDDNKYWGAGKRIQKLRKDLECKQQDIDNNPFDCKIREEHANILLDFNIACNDEEKLLAQRAKIKWLQDGDNNSKFFHKIVKSRGISNRIQMVLNEDGCWVSGKAMIEKFVSHFNKFLGYSRVAVDMIRVVTDEEIKLAMFDIDDNRAPGPDGYSSKFFKSSWSIVGPDVCKAVREFFWTGKLLKGINATRIVLVPKVEVPRKVSDFRPIACCNTFYKCISKIIVNRIRNCLGDIVSNNQSAFIPGRSILDNILLAQELMVGYKKKRGTPKCTIKIDIQKAYDTVDWDFLNRVLQGFGFHPVMVKWIMACVSSPWFMLNFNGEDHGSFLWANGEIVKDKAKVKWLEICKPKEYGGLGIKNLRRWNDALLAKHVWNVVNNKNSLWVQWVRINYIGSRNFWDILQKKSMSWTWKRFLEIRKTVRPHVISCVGNGRNTSLWHDWWHPIGILCTIILRREWISNGLSDSALVCDVLQFDSYSWPVEWVNKFPGLTEAPMFCIDSNLNNFGDIVPWYDLVWYNNCIPRNSFILWLAVLNRLKTQDRVRGWEVAGNLLCPFCDNMPDSHNHLFFNCEYSSRIWKYFCSKVGLNLSAVEWNDLIFMLSSMLKLKTGENLIIKCMIASCVSHIWRERNSRLFGSSIISVEGIIASIENEIRLKLMGLRKRTKMINNKIYLIWGISGIMNGE
ncbi:uncharacterized protein LOC128129115 [Lactuca sativa]|uniref:uncharacterized protein LOC128129115 n=1 Tax=Lactuca sativa TaxID=4236 RepID=UPI0022AF5E8F|nr:uncharacterized protein LOC128129115 [Lactuca sativa]